MVTNCGRSSLKAPPTAWGPEHERYSHHRPSSARGLVCLERMRWRRRTDHDEPASLADDPGGCLHGPPGGDRRCYRVPDQFLEQRARAKSLRPVPQRDFTGADAELCPQRRRESRLRSSQHRGQSGHAVDLPRRDQGCRRPQLLARRRRCLRSDLDHLDRELGRCRGRGVRHDGAVASAAGSRPSDRA